MSVPCAEDSVLLAGDLVSDLAASSTVTECRVEKVSELRLPMTGDEEQDVDCRTSFNDIHPRLSGLWRFESWV